jgi:midasin (ATPase involved in ribosome maturation)
MAALSAGGSLYISLNAALMFAELPIHVPLKTVMTGMELLIDRSQLWEQSAAKHVSIADQLASLTALTRRWRQFELSSWHSLLTHALSQHAAGMRPTPHPKIYPVRNSI